MLKSNGNTGSVTANPIEGDANATFSFPVTLFSDITSAAEDPVIVTVTREELSDKDGAKDTKVTDLNSDITSLSALDTDCENA